MVEYVVLAAIEHGAFRADTLANKGRESEDQMTTDDKEWLNNLNDGARLQASEAHHAYKLILKW